MTAFHSLDEMRLHFAEYISRYNQTIHSSLNGQTPQDRFFSEPEQIRRLSGDAIEKSFLLEVERRVSSDNVVKIGTIEYEVRYRYAKQKIRLRYAPDMSVVYVVETDNELTPIRLLNKQENAKVKRERVRLSEGGETA
jgi:hypothetical protein